MDTLQLLYNVYGIILLKKEIVTSLIQAGETEEIEFKLKLNSFQAAAKTVTAFANTSGGYLLIGVDDFGTPKGVTQVDQVQQALSAAIQTISPRPNVNISTETIDGISIVVATVQKASEHSYYTQNGAIYVRVGSTNQRLDGREQLDFIRHKQLLSFGEDGNDLITLSDLSTDKIKMYLDSRGQVDYLSQHSISDFLLSLQLATKGASLRIKNAAVLLFGKNPTQFHPQAEIKLVRFKDTEAVEILSFIITTQSLPNAIEDALQFIRDHLKRSVKMGASATRTEEYEYPLLAIREVIVNAVVHRDYFSHDAIQVNIFSDRMEVISPGGLPKGMSIDLFGSYSVRRNPIIYRILRDMGYVEGFGTGIPKIKNAFRQAGLTDPKFDINDWMFRVIFFNKKGTKTVIENLKDLNPRQKKAISYIHKHTALKANTYAEINHVSYQTARLDINEMIEFGYLKKVGTYRGAYYILNDPI